MAPKNADERLARALILELFLTMAEQQAASEQLAARRSARKERATATDDRERELPEQDNPPFAE